MKFKTVTAPLLGAAIALSFSVATASAALTTTCTGANTASNITWTATSTGGVDPIAYLWSNGSTSTVQTNSYLPGTYTLGLTATDASSTRVPVSPLLCDGAHYSHVSHIYTNLIYPNIESKYNYAM